MDSITTKYDRVLLGFCALTSLVIGGLLITNILSFKGGLTPPPKPGKPAAILGVERSADVDKVTEALNAEPKRQALSLPGGKLADLFVSTPVIKTAEGTVIALLDDAAAQLRPPISNAWLYTNELDLTRDDIAQQDTDGDGYTNLEEFEGKSNPQNRSDLPAFYTKLRYKECVKEPLSLKFAIYNGGEIQLSRTEPKPTKSAFLKAGETFPVDTRFKILKVEMREVTEGGVSSQKPFLIIEDALAPKAPPLDIQLGKTIDHPKLTAKISDELSGKEFILAEGEEFELPKLPGTKILVSKVTEDSTTISFILPGKTERQEQELKVK